MDTITIILILIIYIPIVLGVIFLISGFITSKLSDDKKKPNSMLFIIVSIIILAALIFGSNIGDDTHVFRP